MHSVPRRRGARHARGWHPSRSGNDQVMERQADAADLDEFSPAPDADLPGGPLSDRHPEVGRIVEPESGVDELDKTAEAVANDTGEYDDLSAEEAGMHLTDEP